MGVFSNATAKLYYSINNETFNVLDESIKIAIDSSPTSSPCCVTGDMVISTGDSNESIFAKDIQVGDYVLSMNTTISELSLQKVTDVIVVTRDSIATIKLKDGSILKLAPDHPILTNVGWATCTGESSYDVSPNILLSTPLKVGDLVKTHTGYVEIESIEIVTLTESITVYNFIVENNKNFFASGILLHN